MATATKERSETAAVRGTVTFDRHELVQAFALATRVIPRRALLPTTRMGWLRVTPAGVTLRATDPLRGLWLDLALESTGPWAVFEALIPVREWRRTLSAMESDTVTISRDGDVVSLGNAGALFTFKPGREPEDMPQWPAFEVGRTGAAAGEAFVLAFQRGLFAVSPDDCRPVLACIYLTSGEGGQRVVAADGFRLVSTPFTTDGDLGDVLIPATAARMVVGLVRSLKPIWVPLDVATTGAVLRFQIGERCVLHAEARAGSFPNYRQLFPTSYGTAVTVPAAAVARALRMLAHLAIEGSGIVRMRAAAEGLTLESRSDEEGTGRVRLLAAVDGPSCKIALSWRYLYDAMASLEGDVRMELPETPGAQMVFRSVSEPEFAQVVMPMWVRWGDD